MGFQPRIKSRRTPNHEYTKPLRQKRKEKQQKTKPTRPLPQREPAKIQAVYEVTLKRLHTLGNQKFGTSPFSDHFNRWITNVTGVLCEFESNPDIGVDEQFIVERSQLLSKIGQQLEELRRKEATLSGHATNLANSRKHLEELKTEHLSRIRVLRVRKNREIRRLNGSITRLKKEQDEIIRTKTGFLSGIFGKDRDKLEEEITQKLADVQRQLELTVLKFKVAYDKFNEVYEEKQAPVLEQIKNLENQLDELETDGSLEERWFTCEGLIDAVNTFLQRKMLHLQ